MVYLVIGVAMIIIYKACSPHIDAKNCFFQLYLYSGSVLAVYLTIRDSLISQQQTKAELEEQMKAEKQEKEKEEQLKRIQNFKEEITQLTVSYISDILKYEEINNRYTSEIGNISVKKHTHNGVLREWENYKDNIPYSENQFPMWFFNALSREEIDTTEYKYVYRNFITENNYARADQKFENHLNELIDEYEEKENRLDKEFEAEKQRLLVGNTNYIMLKVKLSNQINNDNCINLFEAIKNVQMYYDPKVFDYTYDSKEDMFVMPKIPAWVTDDIYVLINKIYKNLDCFIENYK